MDGRWRRLARRGNRLLLCASGGMTTHGPLWSRVKYLAVHPKWRKVVVPGSWEGTTVGDTMEVDFVPTTPAPVVRKLRRQLWDVHWLLPGFEDAYQTITHSCEVVARGMWYKRKRDFESNVFQIPGGSGFELNAYGLDDAFAFADSEPNGAYAYVVVKDTVKYSEVVYPSGAVTPETTREDYYIVRVNASMNGTWVDLVDGCPDESVRDEWKNGGVATFPVGHDGGDSTLVTYEPEDDDDFPIGVDYRPN